MLRLKTFLTGFALICVCSPVSSKNPPVPFSFLGDKDPPAKVNDNIVSTDPNDVKFYLYTNSRNVSSYQELVINNTSLLAKSSLQSDCPIRFLIHGFLHGPGSLFPQNVKNASLSNDAQKRDFERDTPSCKAQVVIVGWSALATIKYFHNPPTLAAAYQTAVKKNIESVGNQVGKFISFLIDNKKTQLDMVHLIGHSLGAHLSGYTGIALKKQYGKQVPRITGLDPAGPLFYTGVVGRPLTKDDAVFVDIVHTSDGTYGKLDLVQKGHVDFYSDVGSMMQPGCSKSYKTVLLDILSLGVCSHLESTVLYSRSVGTTSMKGCRCTDYISFRSGKCPCGGANETIFGDNCDSSTRGKFYLQVKS